MGEQTEVSKGFSFAAGCFLFVCFLGFMMFAGPLVCAGLAINDMSGDMNTFEAEEQRNEEREQVQQHIQQQVETQKAVATREDSLKKAESLRYNITKADVDFILGAEPDSTGGFNDQVIHTYKLPGNVTVRATFEDDALVKWDSR